MNGLKVFAATAITLLGMSSATRADLIAGFINQTPSGNPAAPFQYNYNLSLTAGDQIVNGNYLTLYDVLGLNVASIVAPVGFSVSTQLLGTTPTTPFDTTAFVADNAGIVNITFTRNGGSITAVNSPTQLIGTFSFQSTQGQISSLKTYAATYVNDGTTAADNAGTTTGPSAVPEPSVTAMVGVGCLLGLGYRKVRRGRKGA